MSGRWIARDTALPPVEDRFRTLQCSRGQIVTKLLIIIKQIWMGSLDREVPRAIDQNLPSNRDEVPRTWECCRRNKSDLEAALLCVERKRQQMVAACL
jgi:hypothetical protein